MAHIKALFLLTLILFLPLNEGYRILCAFPFNGKSHFVMFEGLCKGLAKRGHRVDMISHFPTKHPVANYTDIIDLSGTRKQLVNGITIEFGKRIHQSLIYFISKDFGSALCHLMGSPDMQKFLKNPPNDPPYDLVITESFGSPCYIALGQYLQTQVALVISFMEMPLNDDHMGNPTSYAFFSSFFMNKPTVDTFYDRLINFLNNYIKKELYYHYTSEQTELARKYLGRDIMDVRQLEKSVSLLLTNSHYSFYGIKPLTPAVVQVGGLHIEADQSKLTPELERWLNSSEHGIVYFTLGSMLNIETLPKDTLLSLYASFAKIAPMKILMKYGNTTMLPPNLPSNVATMSWIPQLPVLKHKNTRAFITHGGLMGIQEAIYCGIPMIGIPVFVDQIKNVNLLVHKNIAVKLHLDEITEQSMDAALNAVLYDPKYRESVRRESKMFRDRPNSIIDTATYWIEYIIRNGPNSLRSPAVDLPWWKLYLIDVFAFLIVSSLLLVYLLAKLLRIVLRIVRNSFHVKQKIH